MITGVVHAREGRIALKVRGLRGERTIDVVIDTGFTAHLTLPPSVVSDLGLAWRSIDRGILADGSECLFDVYDSAVEWDGEWCPVFVNEMDATPLVGMTLLDDCELTMQVRDGGKLKIKRLPHSRRT